MDNDLPQGWTCPVLDDLLIFKLGGDWGKEPEFEDPEYVEVRCIRASELRNWQEEKGVTAALRKIKTSSLAKRELVKDDILVEISGGGPEQPVGRTVLISNDVLAQNPNHKKVCTNFFRLIRPGSEVNASYLNAYLQYFYASGEISKYQSGSNNLRNLKFNDYLQLCIPLPPLDEQKNIVAKIEELFSELDSGVASLKTAQQQLDIYRQSLLKYAFEGKLTEQWRKDNADKLETPEQLLDRIQQEREARYLQQLEEWQQAVKDWQAEGKERRRPRRPAKPAKLEIVEDIEGVDSLPWTHVNYESICELIRNGISAKPTGESGTKIFRISAVRAMKFDLDDFRYIENKDGQYDDFFLKKGDLVFTRYNGTREYVGVCAEYKSDENRLYPDKLILTRLGIQSVLPGFLEKAFATGVSRGFLEQKIRTTAGQSGISGGDVKSTPVPICSLAEQQEIINQLEEKLSIIDQNEKEIETALAKAELLRQSILKKAFSGKLLV